MKEKNDVIYNVFKPIGVSYIGGPSTDEIQIEPSQEEIALVRKYDPPHIKLDQITKNLTYDMYVVIEVSPSDKNLVKPVDFFFSKKKAIAFLKEQQSLYPDKTFEISSKYAVVRQIIEKFLEMKKKGEE